MKLIPKLELSQLINSGKPQLIVGEGPQGVGKTSITNGIREQLTQTNLLRLTGGKSDDLDMIRENYLAIQGMLDMTSKHNVDINYLFDRTFFTEWCYRRLGYKGDKDSFEKVGVELICRLANLNDKYDITIVNLTADAETFEARLRRDKPQYNNVEFNVLNSLDQQKAYKELFGFIESLFRSIHIPEAVKIVTYDTSSDKPVDDKVNEILNMVYAAHHK